MVGADSLTRALLSAKWQFDTIGNHMKRIAWRIVLTLCVLNLCLVGWGVVEGVRWAGSLVSCV